MKEIEMFVEWMQKIRRVSKVALYQLGFIDRVIENNLLVRFRKQKPEIIEKFLKQFTEKHPEKDCSVLHASLQKEANRVCYFTDRAILRANIKKAKYTFWITAIGTTITVFSLNGFNTPLGFVAPPLSSLFTYMATIVSITAFYNQRAKGAMNSILKGYEEELVKAKLPSRTEHASDYTIDISCPMERRIILNYIPSTVTISTLLNQTTVIAFAYQSMNNAEPNELPRASSQSIPPPPVNWGYDPLESEEIIWHCASP